MSALSILAAAREAPDRIALTDGVIDCTFGELAARVEQRQGELVAWLGEPSPLTPLVAVATDPPRQAIEVLLALIELGVPFLPLHQRSTAAEREALLTPLPVRCALELAGDGLRAAPRAGAPSPDLEALHRCSPLLAALATSGSTGRPRLALLSRAAFEASAAASAAHLGWETDERWLLCLPLAHIGGLSVVTRCLLGRGTIVVPPTSAAPSPAERLAAALRQGRPTIVSMVPAQLDQLLGLAGFQLPATVRAILTGGAAASPALLRRSAERGWPVLTSYGLTEACSQVATQRPGTCSRAELGVGFPLPGVGVRLEQGCIVLTGPTLASGWLEGARVELIDAGRGYSTSDLGRFDGDGRLHVLGRADDVIISGGENVVPAEVEGVLSGCDGVLEACVFGVPDGRFGEVVAAGLRTERRDVRSVVAEADAAARAALAVYKRPRYYVCARDFVYKQTGKLDRRETSAALRRGVLGDPERHRAPSRPRAS